MNECFEYKLEDHPHRDGLQALLDTLGDEGWELCNSGYEGGTGNTLIFKREKTRSAS